MVNVITDRSSDHVNQLGLNVQITEPPEEPWEADSNSPITLERVVVGIDSQVDDLTVRIAAAGRGRGWREPGRSFRCHWCGARRGWSVS